MLRSPFFQLFRTKIGLRTFKPSVFPTLAETPKPSSKNKCIYGLNTFWRLVCRKRDQLAHIQAVLRRISGQLFLTLNLKIHNLNETILNI
jgi:hypothetical protein